MPRSDSISHTLMFSDLAAADPASLIRIQGPEAHHAVRVKRIRAGEKVRVLDGIGSIATGTLSEIVGSKSRPEITIELETIVHHPKPSPAVEIWSALPKGDRLDRMIDQLSQIGISTYRPLLCDRSQRKPETIRLDKLQRIAREASKQCQRPWTLEIGEPIAFAEALAQPGVILADASGGAFPDTQINCSITDPTIILIGPEGGWSDAERTRFGATSVPVYRFGSYILRIEAAACSAGSIVLNALACQASPSKSPTILASVSSAEDLT
ncbi:MAG: RsmE family RNA methyltransferase [Phycisphaerales bacterium]